MTDQNNINKLNDDELAQIAGGSVYDNNNFHIKCKACGRGYSSYPTKCTCGCDMFEDSLGSSLFASAKKIL